MLARNKLLVASKAWNGMECNSTGRQGEGGDVMSKLASYHSPVHRGVQGRGPIMDTF